MVLPKIYLIKPSMLVNIETQLGDEANTTALSNPKTNLEQSLPANKYLLNWTEKPNMLN